MDSDISTVVAQERRSEPGPLDVAQFARSIRQLAIETHAILSRPDATRGEVADLRRRLKESVLVARDSRLTAIERWLRSAARMLATRLGSGSELERGLTFHGDFSCPVETAGR
jgi:hypothetical protein